MIYVIKMQSFDPLVMIGLPDGDIKGSVKLHLPETLITIAESDFGDLLPSAGARMSLGAVDMEGVDVSHDEFVALVEKIKPDLIEYNRQAKVIYEEALAKLPDSTRRLLYLKALTNSLGE